MANTAKEKIGKAGITEYGASERKKLYEKALKLAEACRIKGDWFSICAVLHEAMGCDPHTFFSADLMEFLPEFAMVRPHEAASINSQPRFFWEFYWWTVDITTPFPAETEDWARYRVCSDERLTALALMIELTGEDCPEFKM